MQFEIPKSHARHIQHRMFKSTHFLNARLSDGHGKACEGSEGACHNGRAALFVSLSPFLIYLGGSAFGERCRSEGWDWDFAARHEKPE